MSVCYTMSQWRVNNDEGFFKAYKTVKNFRLFYIKQTNKFFLAYINLGLNLTTWEKIAKSQSRLYFDYTFIVLLQYKLSQGREYI